MSETDGIEEAFEGQLRVLATAASQIGERVARGREQALRQAQTHSEQEARELQARFAAERQAARALLSSTHRTEWWDRANPHDISYAYQTATAWSHEDPEAVRAEQRIRDEVRNRYGIDLTNAGADPEAVRRAMEQAQHNLTTAGEENRRAAQEAAEAQRLMNQADAQERAAENTRQAAEHEPDPQDSAQATAGAAERHRVASTDRYDGAERRAATAQTLEESGIDGEVVAIRMRADASQAHPATEAVAKKAKPRSSKARKNRGRGPQQAQRAGLGR